MANPPIVFADAVIGDPVVFWGAGTGTRVAGGGRGSPARNALRNPVLTWVGPAKKLWIAHFAIKAAGWGHVGKNITLGGVVFTFATDGTISVLGQSTPRALPAGSWQHVTLLVYRDPSAGLASVYFNETLQLALTGQNTGSGTSTNVVFNTADVVDAYDYCDIFIAASDTSSDLPYGDRPVFALMPSGAGGHTDFTPSAGSNYQCVDEQPPNDDTDYVSSSTATNRDAYAMDDLPAAVGTVYAVIPVLYARKTDAGSRSLTPGFRIGTTDYDGTAQNLSTSYGYMTQVFMVSPATSAAWTASEVNGAQLEMLLG